MYNIYIVGIPSSLTYIYIYFILKYTLYWFIIYYNRILTISGRDNYPTHNRNDTYYIVNGSVFIVLAKGYSQVYNNDFNVKFSDEESVSVRTLKSRGGELFFLSSV